MKIRKPCLHRLFCDLVIMAWCLSSITTAQGQQIYEPIYYFSKCYEQLTHKSLPPNHSLAAEVVAGTKTYSQACAEVLAKAQLLDSGANAGRLVTPNDTESKNVLKTMYNVFRSWFTGDYKHLACAPIHHDFFDRAEGALFFLNSMFRPSTHVSSAVTATNSMVAIRTNSPATGNSALSPFYGIMRTYFADYFYRPGTLEGEPEDQTEVGSILPLTFQPTGELLGTREISSTDSRWNQTFRIRQPRQTPREFRGTNEAYDSAQPLQPVFPFRSRGAGPFGTTSYLLQYFGLAEFRVLDGGAAVPRLWSQAVLRDAVCAAPPIIHVQDLPAGAVNANHPLAFHHNASCMQCHQSYDPLAGGLRNVSKRRIHMSTPQFCLELGAYFEGDPPDLTVFGQPEPLVPTPNPIPYWMQEPSGQLMFRNYKGGSDGLTNISFYGVSDLGTKLASLDDYYICTAKKIFRYFTGIEAYVSDPESPNAPDLTNPEILGFRQKVISLGLSLKSHGSLQTLVREILDSNTYLYGREQ